MASLTRFRLTSSDRELLLRIDRDEPVGLASQIQRGLRAAIRVGSLRGGVQLPSTRSLARQLGVSRPVVVDAYAQLAAEGYLELRQGARPIVGKLAAPAKRGGAERAASAPRIRFDLRPNLPDLAMFPRRAWLRATRIALAEMTHDELGYDDRHGSPRLRRALADYLGRVRGVVAEPEQIVIVNGFADGRSLICRVLKSEGVRRLAVEDPSYWNWEAVEAAGLTRVPIRVDEGGIDVVALHASKAKAVFLTPAHQFPTGAVLGAARRQAIVKWLEERRGFALEDDYDAEFRYDHAPVGALQGLAPDRVIYAGTASKTLAPALRLGWLVVPHSLLMSVQAEQQRWNEGGPRIDQNALAVLIESGFYDRHLRRMRRVYRARRDLLLGLLAELVPEAKIEGVSAGLHATVRLLPSLDAGALQAELRAQGLYAEEMSRYRGVTNGPPTFLLGYGRASGSTLRGAVRVLARAIARRRASSD
jgi:GntR family transcriptional regulator/MocR family aminotransferase